MITCPFNTCHGSIPSEPPRAVPMILTFTTAGGVTGIRPLAARRIGEANFSWENPWGKSMGFKMFPSTSPLIRNGKIGGLQRLLAKCTPWVYCQWGVATKTAAVSHFVSFRTVREPVTPAMRLWRGAGDDETTNNRSLFLSRNWEDDY